MMKKLESNGTGKLGNVKEIVNYLIFNQYENQAGLDKYSYTCIVGL